MLHRERSKRAGAHIDKVVSARGDFLSCRLTQSFCCCAPIAFLTPLDWVSAERVEERLESLHGFK